MKNTCALVAVILAKMLLLDLGAAAEMGAGVGKTEVPAWGNAATPATDVIQVDGVKGYTTYQLRLVLAPTVSNVYTIFGDVAHGHPMHFPPAYQVPSPFGTNVGGTNTAFWPISPMAQFDSWLTVGETAGNADPLSSIGIPWEAWTEDGGLSVTDGAVFWMVPDDAPPGNAVVAQLTMPNSVSDWSVVLNAQGRTTEEGNWQALDITFTALGSTTPTKPPAGGGKMPHSGTGCDAKANECLEDCDACMHAGFAQMQIDLADCNVIDKFGQSMDAMDSAMEQCANSMMMNPPPPSPPMKMPPLLSGATCTTATRGQPAPAPCTAGLSCVLMQYGIEMPKQDDRPRSGTCMTAAEAAAAEEYPVPAAPPRSDRPPPMPPQTPPPTPAPAVSADGMCTKDQSDKLNWCLRSCARCREQNFQDTLHVLGECEVDGLVATHSIDMFCPIIATVHANAKPPSACTQVQGRTDTMSTSLPGYNTYQLVLMLGEGCENVYTIFGEAVKTVDPADTRHSEAVIQRGFSGGSLDIPAAYQEARPFGADVGGASPAFYPIVPTAAFDSWLTVGITEGDGTGQLSSIGIDFASWSETKGLSSENGAVFMMVPDDGPIGDATSGARAVVVAQLTISAAVQLHAQVNAQGRSNPQPGTLVEVADWEIYEIGFGGETLTPPPAPAKPPARPAMDCSIAGLAAVAGDCPAAAGSSSVPASCPQPCARSVNPWFTSCGQTSQFAAADAGLGGQLSPFGLLCKNPPRKPPSNPGGGH